MAHENPPWELPAAGCARGSGSPGGRIGKPLETMGRKARGCRAQFAQCSFGCNLANHRKRWDAKPEAKAHPVRNARSATGFSLRPSIQAYAKKGRI